MTGVAVTAAGPQRAGLAAALVNAARQAGGALGVALLDSAALYRAAERSNFNHVPPGPSDGTTPEVAPHPAGRSVWQMKVARSIAAK
jgi:hypothetical protein